MPDDGWGADSGAGWGDTSTAGGWGDDAGTDQNQNKTGGGSGCRNCGEEGHFARDCPTKKRDSGCRNCGEEGHFARDCEKPRKEGGGGGGACHKCGEEGHRKADCPQGGGEEKKGCFKCGGDHMARDCEKPDTCRNCGAEGHMKKDCTEEPKTRVIESEDGTKREIYVPKEVADDDLFNSGINTGINFDKFDKIKVVCTGDDAPKPVGSFEDMALRSLLLENVKKSNYSKPTPIQKTAIPIIMKGRDLMACAQTGSGKTAAFLLPILHKLMEEGCESGAGESPQKPQAIIVAPTRELAIQIKDEARKFSQGSMMRCNIAYGGTSVGFQLSNLFRGTNILIATPGRLMHFVEHEKVAFDEVRFLVLDEADRMLDLGFLPDIQRICSNANMPAPGKRQTLMFSATFPESVQHLALEFLNNYLFLAIGIVGGASSDVTQSFFEVEKFGKRDKLVEILKDVGTDRTLVFVQTKKNADFLATFLSSQGLPTTSIHGDRLQREREEALGDFRSGRMPILIATAVAARGLDIKGVAHVINYDLPSEIDEYVHRIGRTGRVGNIGKATSFYDPGENAEIAPDLVKILGDLQLEVPDFLQGGMGGGTDYGGAGAFGGVDIRKDKVAAAAAADDEWG